MAPIAQQIAQMVDMLPMTDQMLALALVRKLVLAWDPDYTETAPDDLKAHRTALEEYLSGQTVAHDEINWD